MSLCFFGPTAGRKTTQRGARALSGPRRLPPHYAYWRGGGISWADGKNLDY